MTIIMVGQGPMQGGFGALRPLAVLAIMAIVWLMACMPAGALDPPGALPNPLSISMDTSSQEATVTIGYGCRVLFTGNVSMRAVPIPGQVTAVSLEAELDTYWNVSVEPRAMTFTGQGSQNFTANVSVPAGAPASPTVNLVITARATVAGLSFTQEATATITVRPYFWLQIDTKNLYAEIQPGGRAQFKLQVWNLGNADDSADLSISYEREGKRAGWEARINTTVLDDIPSGEYREVGISVDSPKGWDWALRTAELFSFEFVAVSRGAAGQGNSSASTSLPLVVREEGFNMTGFGAILAVVAVPASFLAFYANRFAKMRRRRGLEQIASKRHGRRNL
jgi:hypothetical protein